MKKVISVIIAAIILFVPVISVYANEYTEIRYTYPTVYLKGQGTRILEADPNNGAYCGNDIYPVSYDIGEILLSVNKLHVPFSKGVLTGNWDDWCDTFVEIVSPIFSSYSMDENGNTKKAIYHIPPAKYDYNNDGKYGSMDYHFLYDWRGDPILNADHTENYISMVMSVTGEESVNIIGRCLGGNVLLTYLQRHASTKLKNVVFYCSGLEGFDVVGRIFTGNIKINSELLSSFISDYLVDGTNETTTLKTIISDFIKVLDEIDALGVGVNAFEDIYKEVYKNVVPRILLESFGTMPAFWSLVDDNHFEEAKSFVFGENKEKYKHLIEKIDNYHYGTMLHYKEIINNAINMGINVYIVSKYGLQMIPIEGSCNLQSDTILEASSSSAGATCSLRGHVLNYAYINNLRNEGKIKYLSPDRKIDASTCFLPDHTWFIKNLNHMSMPIEAEKVINKIIESDGYTTVFDNPDIPQYLIFNSKDNSITPLTEENDINFELRDISVEDRFVNFCSDIFESFVLILKNIFQ